MQINHEELILRNPAIGACAFWHMARSYGDHTLGRAPTLPLYTVSFAIIFHSSSVDKIWNMRFDSGFSKLAMERPDLVADLQERMETYLLPSLQALQAGVSAKILAR